jgi:tetratricopeptide (TPR) repeat protein
MGENYHLSTTAAFLAEALFEQGQLEKAERFTRASEELATEGDITSQFLWRTVRGKILAHQGYAAAGVILVRQALDLMATAEEPDSEASGLLDLAEVLALEHKLEQARQALEHAIALFEAKGNIIASQRARERLAVLAPAAQRLRRSHDN